MAKSWHMTVELTPPLVACVISEAGASFASPRDARMRHRGRGEIAALAAPR
jgi:hypothetical protein